MNEAAILCWSAAVIGLVHTLLGPDHYVPFVAMSRAAGWTQRKTLTITALCGMGHVLGSIILGIVGVVLGTAIFKLEKVEAVRGEIAAWLMIASGLFLFAWSGVRAIRRRPHTHWHTHEGGTLHRHEHNHESGHMHVHSQTSSERAYGRITPWVLFTIFLFGPCEPLIPLLMFPAASASWRLLVLVTFVFAVATISTMVLVVWAGTKVTSTIQFGLMGRFSQPLAALMVLGCGILIKVGF